jgi:uncharacterized protein (TIGR02599 family)
MVSMAILSLLILVLMTMVNQTSSMWRYTNSKIDQFRAAREGFEAMTRRLSQATLNTYWDYDNPNAPTKYIRQSELRFITGPVSALNMDLVPDTTDEADARRLGHAAFFYAPLGFVVPTDSTDTTYANYSGLDNLLNLWGYYLEYNGDRAVTPEFLVGRPPRKRFRLMELMQSSQSLQLYKLEAGSLTYNSRAWFQNPLKAIVAQRPVHILAENIVSLVILPKLAPQAQKTSGFSDASLAPKYLYDSTGTGMTTLSNPLLDPKNQLPPVVQVTMVAIDEASVSRLTDADNKGLADTVDNLFADATKLNQDLKSNSTKGSDQSLESYLRNKRIGYRIFSNNVSIRGAKWSTNQKD